MRTGVRRVVHTSSIATIGYRADRVPADEDTEWNWGPADIAYFTTKHLGEGEALKGLERGVDVVIVNPAIIFGARDVGWKAGRIFRLIDERSTQLLPAALVTTCDVDDVCEGHIAAMERGRSGERYILGGATVSLADLFRLAAEIMRRPVRVITVPYPLAVAAAWVVERLSIVTRKEPPFAPESLRAARKSFPYDSTKAIRELGYPQTPLHASLEKGYRWYREQGLLPPRGRD